MRLLRIFRYRLMAPHRAYQRFRSRPLDEVLFLFAGWAALCCVGLTTAAAFAAHVSAMLTLLWFAGEGLILAPLCFCLAWWLARKG